MFFACADRNEGGSDASTAKQIQNKVRASEPNLNTAPVNAERHKGVVPKHKTLNYCKYNTIEKDANIFGATPPESDTQVRLSIFIAVYHRNTRIMYPNATRGNEDGRLRVDGVAGGAGGRLYREE